MLDTFINQSESDCILCLMITINWNEYSKLKKNNTNDNLNYIINTLTQKKYQTNYIYIAPEINENNTEHYHILLGTKTILDYNKCMKENILHEIKEEISSDTIIKNLNDFENIKRGFNYLINPKKEKKININKHVFCLDEYIWEQNNKMINYIDKTKTIKTKKINSFKINNEDYGSCNNTKINDYTNYSIILVVKWYTIIKKIKYKDGFLFEKIKESENAYKQFKKTNWIKNNLIKIIHELTLEFPLNMKKVNLNPTLSKYTITKEQFDNALNNLTHNHDIEFVFDIIEFKNGYYFFKFNKFLKKKYLEENNLKLKNNKLLIKYYNNNYYREYTPKIWIKHVCTAIDIPIEKAYENETFQKICGYIGNTVIKNQDVFEKKKVLYVWGKSNTGKTTIIGRPLLQYFGLENIGIMSGSKSFELEGLVKKEVGLLDEYKYNKKKRERDLKLFEGQPILEDIKYKEQEIIKELNLIVLSNYNIDPNKAKSKEEIKHSDEALANRTYIVEFLQKENIKHNLNYIDFLSTKEKKKIEKEDPYTLIYCNRILHEYFIKNKGKTNNKYIIKEIIEKNLEIEKRQKNKQLNKN